MNDLHSSMTALLSNSGSAYGRPLGASKLIVNGTVYHNSAAKFWSALLDELIVEFPRCDGAALQCIDERPLSRDLLRPQKSFEESLDRIRPVDVARLLAETIQELELFGPPQAVRLRLYHREREFLYRELPLECLDSEVFPFLLVWLLVWAELPEALWDQTDLNGSFTAEDPQRKLCYNVSYQLQTRDISEGLLERRVNLHWSRYRTLRHRGGKAAP